MIWYVGRHPCYERYAHEQGFSRTDLGRKIFFAASRDTLKGRRWQEGDELVVCEHCKEEWSHFESDLNNFIRIMEWIERLQANVPNVRGKNNGV